MIVIKNNETTPLNFKILFTIILPQHMYKHCWQPKSAYMTVRATHVPGLCTLLSVQFTFWILTFAEYILYTASTKGREPGIVHWITCDNAFYKLQRNKWVTICKPKKGVEHDYPPCLHDPIFLLFTTSSTRNSDMQKKKNHIIHFCK